MNQRAAEKIYQALRNDIQMQRILPSMQLQEGQLAERFNVSRTPVREAIRRLVYDGLLERRGTSTRIRRLSVDEVANIYPIIASMEGLAARLAASRVTADELELLASLHDEMSADCATSVSGFVSNNQAFHDTIITAARNQSLANEIERFRMITGQFRRAVLGIPYRKAQSAAEHAAILNALSAGDEIAAENAMRTHVGSAEEVLMVLLRTSLLVAPGTAGGGQVLDTRANG